MTDKITTAELLRIIDSRDKHTQEKFVDVMSTLGDLANHMVISIEDKKHDIEFKREVREHLKTSAPLLEYVKENKAVFSKLKIAFFVAVMFSFLGLVGFSLK